ncbi:hypothetical protein Tco_1272321, partial [Tanacetum coccineum]
TAKQILGRKCGPSFPLRFVPSCRVIFDLEPLSFLLTISLDNLCLDNLDIFKEDLENQSCGNMDEYGFVLSGKRKVGSGGSALEGGGGNVRWYADAWGVARPGKREESLRRKGGRMVRGEALLHRWGGTGTGGREWERNNRRVEGGKGGVVGQA